MATLSSKMVSLPAAEIKTQYESNADTNAFTDADEAKLDAIEASADVTDETNVVASLNGATLTSVTPADDDEILIQDTSDSGAIKTITKSDLSSGGWTEMTAISPFNGKPHTFSGFPSGTTEIFIYLEGVSTSTPSGARLFVMTIGDSGGLETSGYLGGMHIQDGTGPSTSTSEWTVGNVDDSSNGYATQTSIMLRRINEASNDWTFTSNNAVAAGAGSFGAGFKSLSAELTQLSISCTGSNVFDASGVGYVMYK